MNYFLNKQTGIVSNSLIALFGTVLFLTILTLESTLNHSKVNKTTLPATTDFPNAYRIHEERIVTRQSPPIHIPRSKFKTEKINLTIVKIKSFAMNLVKLYPNVNVTVSGDRIKLSVTKSSDYEDWQAAIGGLILMGGKDVVFETTTICGQNCSEFYAFIEFHPQQIKYLLSKS